MSCWGDIIPHRDSEGRYYNRVTEISNSAECEEKAFHTREKFRSLERGESDSYKGVTTFAAVVGTMVHNQIENFIREQEGLPPEELSLDHNGEKLLMSVMKMPEMKEELEEKKDNAFMNFLHFWNDYEPIPLEIEATLMGRIEGVDIKGSSDLICAIKRQKLWDLGRVAKKDRVGDPEGYDMVILDWKSGSTHQSSHKTQLAGYYLLAEKDIVPQFQEKFPYHEVKGFKRGMDVYLGGDSYRAMIFDLNFSNFLFNVDIYKRAERRPLNHIIGRLGVNLHYCIYCPFKDRCSAYLEGTIPLGDAT
jgi:hypothetical protein